MVLGLWAAPASADPPRPTNYRSTVTAVEPALPTGASVRVIGGDSLLELRIPRGHTAEVADYPGSSDEEPVPYLRFDADGTVRRNRLAVATQANRSRYGTATGVPDPGAAPEWETVATDGRYAWHDHRIHWMSPKAPRAVARDGQVDLGGPDGTWQVPITVDGKATVVSGTLVLQDPPFLLGWLALALVVAVGEYVLGVRLGQAAAVPAAAGVALLATWVAWSTWSSVPADAGATPVPLAVAAVAVAASVVSLIATRTGPPVLRRVATAATAAALLGWGLVRAAVLARAVLPTDLDPTIDRATTAAAIGVGAALAALLVLHPSSRPTGRTSADEAATSAPAPST